MTRSLIVYDLVNSKKLSKCYSPLIHAEERYDGRCFYLKHLLRWQRSCRTLCCRQGHWPWSWWCGNRDPVASLWWRHWSRSRSTRCCRWRRGHSSSQQPAILKARNTSSGCKDSRWEISEPRRLSKEDQNKVEKMSEFSKQSLGI